jgi:hypothetical protein
VKERRARERSSPVDVVTMEAGRSRVRFLVLMAMRRRPRAGLAAFDFFIPESSPISGEEAVDEERDSRDERPELHGATPPSARRKRRRDRERKWGWICRLGPTKQCNTTVHARGRRMS